MPFAFPRWEVVPLPDYQTSFRLEGTERLRWHYGPSYPRPFLYPLISPSGFPLTRMGHPGAPNHDHHRSIWFAHDKVLGIDFWSDRTTAKIRQKEWLAYQEGDEGVMAVRLGWFDGHDPRELLDQELIIAVRSLRDNEIAVELQSTFKPLAESLEFGKTNFGFLAVRVAKSISAFFGGGNLTNSEGAIGEPAIFGKAAAWMDYSGPTAKDVTEGITYFDHPSNPGFPNKWHVREDGWMGASPCMDGPLTTKRMQPLVMRAMLYAHRGTVNREKANQLAKTFGESPRWEVKKATIKHTQWIVERIKG